MTKPLPPATVPPRTTARPPAATVAAGAAATAPSSTAARTALAWAHGARFLTTASRLDQLPGDELPEIAFVGRSNAGKSTAINTLAQHRRLAFASRTPGRTQHINLFEIGPVGAPDALLADLPGYGYAAVERAAKLRWQAVMSDYLQLRRPLHGVVLLIDSRHGFTDLDRRLLALLAPRLANGEVRLLALLTKADKLSKNALRRSVDTAREVLGEVTTDEADIALATFSALSRHGLDDLAETLHGWAVARPAGTTGVASAGVVDAAGAAGATATTGAAGTVDAAGTATTAADTDPGTDAGAAAASATATPTDTGAPA